MSYTHRGTNQQSFLRTLSGGKKIERQGGGGVNLITGGVIAGGDLTSRKVIPK